MVLLNILKKCRSVVCGNSLDLCWCMLSGRCEAMYLIKYRVNRINKTVFFFHFKVHSTAWDEFYYYLVYYRPLRLFKNKS